MVDLHLCDFLVLVSSYSDEGCFLEDISSEGGVGKLQDITGSHKMESRLVFVHRVQNGLEIEKKKTFSFN